MKGSLMAFLLISLMSFSSSLMGREIEQVDDPLTERPAQIDQDSWERILKDRAKDSQVAQERFLLNQIMLKDAGLVTLAAFGLLIFVIWNGRQYRGSQRHAGYFNGFKNRPELSSRAMDLHDPKNDHYPLSHAENDSSKGEPALTSPLFQTEESRFSAQLLDLHPELTAYDLKLCQLVRLNLSSKEIAAMLNISPASVNTARYRLRKRLQLREDQDLNKYLISLK